MTIRFDRLWVIGLTLGTAVLTAQVPRKGTAVAATPSPAVHKPPALPDEFRAYTEHPRLLLPARRLRLLRRERERKTMRWEQFEALIASKAEFPEPGFALALYYASSEDAAAGKQAVEWALSPAATDLRQLALVFDWCQPVLTESQSKRLASKLLQGLEREAALDTVAAARNRVFAAIALADHVPAEVQERYLRSAVADWWVGKIVPKVQKDRGALQRTDGYHLMELMHAVRDNLNFDMRDNALLFFRDFPLHRVISYYPATYPAADAMYRIPQYSGLGEPDLKDAALSRAADLSIVAFDTNALEHQFLQGWLIQDNFIMKSAFGAPYEFLWANPYQPGLSYHHLPNFFHDPVSGTLLLRSTWEEDAVWMSYAKGEMELFLNGKRSGLKPRSGQEPLQIGDHVIMVGESKMRLSLVLPETARYFLVGLKPNTRYEIEVDDEELTEARSDAGGILALTFPASQNVNVLIRESTYKH